MTRRLPLLPTLLVLALPLAAADLPVASPFTPAATTPAVPAPVPSLARWELIGILGTREAPAVRLMDRSLNAGAWVKVGETFGDVRLVAADLDAGTATVQFGDARLKLSIRASAVAAGTATAVSGGSGAAPTAESPGGNAGMVPPAAAAEYAAADARGKQAIEEREARMLVSDLLEISMIQRKAYEEKQIEAAKATEAAR
jgi:hypothetical protein